MGNGLKIDLTGIKEILNQIFISQPQFPITDKKALVRALGGETSLIKINSDNDTHSSVILAETAFSNSQVFQDSNDIIDGILGGSYSNALTKYKIYQELQGLEYPVKHHRDMEKLSSTIQLFGYAWDPIKERLKLPINSSADIILALSAVDPSLVGTDISLIGDLETPDLTKEVKPPGVKMPIKSATPPLPPPIKPKAPSPPVTPPPPPAPPPIEAETPPEIPAAPEVSEKIQESKPLAENEIEMKSGFSYLMKEDKPIHCYEIFSESLKSGYAGLCITRTNPRQIRDKFNIIDTSIQWLTDRKGSEGTTIAPALETIVYTIEGFIKKNDRSLILIDGLEYLISVNKFNPVLSFVRRLVDFVSERDAAFIVPISPLTMGEQELKILEREMEPVNENEILRLPEGDSVSSEPKQNPTNSGSSGSTEADSGTTVQASEKSTESDADGKRCTPCEGTGTCFWCSGTGQCETCKGTGKTPEGQSCSNCDGTGVCDSCKGNKICVWCKGTGKLTED